MTYMIFDSTGNAVAAFDGEVEAHAALRSIVDGEPEVADDLLLMMYDDAGSQIGDAVMYSDLPTSTVSFENTALKLAAATRSLAQVDVGLVRSGAMPVSRPLTRRDPTPA
jgi:hypothetical protein